MSLLATCGNDTVKVFEVSASRTTRDPCVLSHTPSPGCVVNSVKWNHTNLVVASAGDDKKISFWRKNGESIPAFGSDSGDGITESILAINFSNKGSRYICSGGTGKVVRIWDLQRKRCIKWLKGHTDTITGIIYNCKDEHLASISMSGDIILHNLASGGQAAELKDPNEQVLRVLDYSRASRHLLVTAGDDGSVHLWDTTGRRPKVSWLRQHSAPTVGIGLLPSNDKIIASVGMDKKLYLYDSGSKRPTSCVPFEAPFSSLAYRDDGWMLAAGTYDGRVVFYDVRGKPQPFTVLCAYSRSEAVTSLSWQRSKPAIVDESNCTAETILLGESFEESILMPDPLPSFPSSNFSCATVSDLRNPGCSGSLASSSFVPNSVGSISSVEETAKQNHVLVGGRFSRFNRFSRFKDDMDVFSPLIDVQPITPLLDKPWNNLKGVEKGHLVADKKPFLLFPSSNEIFPFKESDCDHTISGPKSSVMSTQDEFHSSFARLESPSMLSFKNEAASIITPPEAWGGERFSDKLISNRQSVNLPSRFAMLASSGPISRFGMLASTVSRLPDLSVSSSLSRMTSLSSSNLTSANLCTGDVYFSQYSLALSEKIPCGSKSSGDTKGFNGHDSLKFPEAAYLDLPRTISDSSKRICTTPSNDGISISTGSPKTKKTDVKTSDKHLINKSEASAVTVSEILPAEQPGKAQVQPDLQRGSSFTNQLFQRDLEETLASFQKSIHADLRNLHIEILRQFHMQEMEMSSIMCSLLKNQAELMKEVQSLRKENRQLHQLL